MIIALEGSDGTGKTTIANMLAKEMNGDRINFKSFGYLVSLMKYIQYNASNTVARFVYGLAGNYLKSNEIRHAISADPGHNIILDRYVYSALVTNVSLDILYNKGAKKRFMYKIFNAEIKNFLEPDVIIFLYADVKEQEKRIGLDKNRKNIEFLDKNQKHFLLTQNLFKKLAKKLKKQGHRVIEIDTTDKSPDEVVGIIKRHF